MAPPSYIGIVLAVLSGCFIGTSFVLKKVGLLRANAQYNEAAGEGYGYLKNIYWWGGMILMAIGEGCNFCAYAFADAILVTPMGALSVVVTTILSAIFLKERLSFIGMAACFMCIVGSITIAVNAPNQSTVSNIEEFKHYVVAPGFLSYAGVIILGAIFTALWIGPRYGSKNMFVYLTVCSTIGGLSVVSTQGLGSAIVAQAGGTPQFNQWFIYVVLVFVICTLLTEIIYLNKALNIYNTALVTPSYYVYFTSCTLITSVILFRGIKGTTPVNIASIVLGFMQICAGSILLQLSKSAKDVPDSKVLTADLGQLHAVAEQEELESEPRADTIRGTAALIRALSTKRQRREAEEVKMMHDQGLEPIGENEIVEWDGLRRRKTVIASPRLAELDFAVERKPIAQVDGGYEMAGGEGHIHILAPSPPRHRQREQQRTSRTPTQTQTRTRSQTQQNTHAQQQPPQTNPTRGRSTLSSNTYHSQTSYSPHGYDSPRSLSPSNSSTSLDNDDSTDAIHNPKKQHTYHHTTDLDNDNDLDNDDTISHNPEDDLGMLPRFVSRAQLRGASPSGVSAPPRVANVDGGGGGGWAGHGGGDRGEDEGHHSGGGHTFGTAFGGGRQFSFSSVFSGRHVERARRTQTEEERLGLVTRDPGSGRFV